MHENDKVPRPPLPKLWPERFRDSMALDVIESGGLNVMKVPTWRELVMEANLLGVNPLKLDDFSTLPSCKSYFEMAKRAAALARVLKGMAHPEDARYVMSWTAVEMYTVFALRRWEHTGQRVFVLDRDLFDLLATTPLPDMPSRRLRMPFNTFYLLFPQGLGMQFDIGVNNLQPLEGVMVTMAKRSGVDDEDELVLISPGKSTDAYDGNDNVVYMTYFLNDTPISELYIPPEDARLKAGNDVVGVVTPRVVINFCLYLMTDQPLLEPVPPHPRVERLEGLNRRKLEREIRRLRDISRLGYTWVGQKPERRVYQESGPSAGRRIEMPVPVRAHWRWQAHGPQWSEHKLILIEEHVRGIVYNSDGRIRASRVQAARRKGDGAV